MACAPDGPEAKEGAARESGGSWCWLNRTGQLALAQQALSALLENAAVDARATYACELVLEEWLLNAWRHGLGDAPDAPVNVWVDVHAGQVILRFEDGGGPFDPTRAELPTPPRPLDAKPGGLGLLMIRRSIEAWQHERIDGVNRLTVRVPRNAPPLR